MIQNDTLFQKNLQRWKLICPGGADAVAAADCAFLSFCRATNGLPNLRHTRKGKESYLHSKQDPMQEAKEWLTGLFLKDVDVVYVYGVGLGYYYEALQTWLREDERRSLIFFEDDPAVIHRFLETERATALLYDPQVAVYLFDDNRDEGIIGFHALTLPYALFPFLITALGAYARDRPAKYSEIRAKVGFFAKMNQLSMQEFDQFGLAVFRNFFHNYLEISHSYLANRLFREFKDVPAIICGAGPSLDKNIHVLAALHDRALIFAGGTALNVLNAHGVMPHFGVGIDPNRSHFNRLVMNHVYELPFFYRSRIVHEGIKVVHGDKLFVTGSPGYGLGKWLEQQLEMEDVPVKEGLNVLNFSLSLAHAMGCNPLICVGVDLAYSRGESYASKIISHAIHERKDNFRTKRIEDDLLLKKDIHGEPIYTLWKWVAESMWYGAFSEGHPDTLLINATEGGIGFPNVTNMVLEDVSKLILTKQYPFTPWIQGTIQNSQLPPSVTFERMMELSEKVKNSLTFCGEVCGKIIENLKRQINAETEANADEWDKALEADVKTLQSELAHEIMLNAFDLALQNKFSLQHKRLELMGGRISEAEIRRKKAELGLARYRSLAQTALYNAHLINEIMGQRKEAETFRQETSQNEGVLQALRLQYPLPIPAAEETYQYDGHTLKIIDPEVGVDLVDDFAARPQDVERLFYASGAVKLEQYYRHKILHGPSTFFSETGTVLSRGWFWEGQQVGKMWTYYSTGELHSLQRFRQGKWEGKQQFFYRDGLPKTILYAINGQLHGDVILYYPHGKLARTLHFKYGKREGEEHLWNEFGQLMIEAHYAADLPVKTAKAWHPNGQLAKEIVYSLESQPLHVVEWDDQGNVVESKKGDGDYFDRVAEETAKLTHSFDTLFSHLFHTLPGLIQRQQPKEMTPAAHMTFDREVHAYAKQFDQLQQQMEHLRELNKAIQTLSDSSQEALWKNPHTRREMEQHITEANQQMNVNLAVLSEEVKKLLRNAQNENKEKSD